MKEKADYERALDNLRNGQRDLFAMTNEELFQLNTDKALLSSLIEKAFRWREGLEEINEVPRSVGCYDRMKAIAREALKEER